MMAAKYLDRDAAPYLSHWVLCTTEEQYLAEMKNLGVPYYEVGRWVNKGANATTHFIPEECLTDPDILPSVHRVIVVCIDDTKANSSLDICGLLTHEAVHVARDYFDQIGETYPASEQMAYAIQYIAQRLMEAYAEQRGV